MTSDLGSARAAGADDLDFDGDEPAAALAEGLTEQDHEAVDAQQMVLFAVPPHRGPPAATEPESTAPERPTRERSLYFEVTKHIRGPSKGPPEAPPPVGWLLLWIPVDLLRRALKYPMTVRDSGGEARRLARLRALILESGFTALVLVLTAGAVYWAGRLVFDPSPVGDLLQARASWAREVAVNVWRYITGVGKVLTGVTLGGAVGAAGVRGVLLWRRRRQRSDEPGSGHQCTCQH